MPVLDISARDYARNLFLRKDYVTFQVGLVAAPKLFENILLLYDIPAIMAF